MALGNRSTPPDWRGVHHLALVTPDMDATVRFYAGVLAMPLVATLRAGPMRHYFFELGPGNTIAFFEVPGAETFSKPAGAPSRGLSSLTTSRSPSTTRRPLWPSNNVWWLQDAR
ncbi:MAG: hypothetical protein Ct9H300mP12_10050 [Acidimicrobiales bacterium]|nr:MAG: hypothetical protein Ct9H300mP12_10050 [Acidimicrobiales bacterium]